MPRPRSLTPERIAAAALTVIDDDGLDALTMRTVAAGLGMSTMALYRYVQGREEIEALVVELVLAPVDTTVPDVPGSWREHAAVLAGRLRAAVGEHPAVVPLLMLHRHRSPALLAWSESMLGVLTAAGFDGTARVVALRAITGHLAGALQLEHLGPLDGPGTGVIAGQRNFPLMAATARAAAEVTPEAEFSVGLAALLAGLRPAEPAAERG